MPERGTHNENRFTQPKSVNDILALNRSLWSLQGQAFEYFLDGWTASIGTRLKQLRGDAVRPSHSVIVPAKNEEAYILQNMESLARQEGFGQDTGFETIIVVNDCDANDRTLDIVQRIQKFAGEDAFQVISYNGKKPGGLALARQTGLDNTRGDIIATTDADVITLPLWLKKLTSPLEDPSVTCVVGNYNYYDRQEIPFLYFESTARILNKSLLRLIPIEKIHKGLLFTTGQTSAFRKNDAENIGGYDMDKIIGEDSDLGKRLGALGRIALVEDPQAVIWSSPRRLRHVGMLTLILKDLLVRSAHESMYLDKKINEMKNHRN